MSHLPRGRAGLIRPSLVQTLETVRLQWFGIYGGVPGEDLQGQGLHTVRSRKDARKMAISYRGLESIGRNSNAFSREKRPWEGDGWVSKWNASPQGYTAFVSYTTLLCRFKKIQNTPRFGTAVRLCDPKSTRGSQETGSIPAPLRAFLVVGPTESPA